MPDATLRSYFNLRPLETSRNHPFCPPPGPTRDDRLGVLLLNNSWRFRSRRPSLRGRDNAAALPTISRLTIEAEVGVACLMPSVIMVSRTAGASIGLEHSCDVAVACRISLLHQVVRTESSSILSPKSLASRGSLLSTLQCDSLGTERIGLCRQLHRSVAMIIIRFRCWGGAILGETADIAVDEKLGADIPADGLFVTVSTNFRVRRARLCCRATFAVARLDSPFRRCRLMPTVPRPGKGCVCFCDSVSRKPPS